MPEARVLFLYPSLIPAETFARKSTDATEAELVNFSMSEPVPFNPNASTVVDAIDAAEKGQHRDTIGGRVYVRQNDVVGGRGRFLIRRPGNGRFEELINRYAPRHKGEGGDLRMAEIQIEIMAQLLPGSRLMTQYCKDTDTAIELTPKGVRAKIGQAIRYSNAAKRKQKAKFSKPPPCFVQSSQQLHPPHNRRWQESHLRLNPPGANISPFDVDEDFEMRSWDRSDSFTRQSNALFDPHQYHDQRVTLQALASRRAAGCMGDVHTMPRRTFPHHSTFGHHALRTNHYTPSEALSSAVAVNAELINQLQADTETSLQDQAFPSHSHRYTSVEPNSLTSSGALHISPSRFEEDKSFHEVSHQNSTKSAAPSVTEDRQALRFYEMRTCTSPQEHSHATGSSWLSSDMDPLPLEKDEDIFRN